MELSPFYTSSRLRFLYIKGDETTNRSTSLGKQGWKAMGRGGTVGVEKYS